MKKTFKVALATAIGLSGLGVFTTNASALEIQKKPSEIQSNLSNIKFFYENADSSKINHEDVVQYLRTASAVVKGNQIKSITPTDANHVVNYTLLEDEYTYFYEDSPLSGESITIRPTKAEFANSNSSIVANSNLNLHGGIGGKATISGGGNYLNTTVQTGTANQTKVAQNGSLAYIYAGFSGTSPSGSSIESDMGLQYSNQYNIWRPVFLYYYNGQKFNIDTFKNNDDKVSYLNGFIPGTDVNMTVYPNLNGNAQLTISGYAKHSDKLGNGTNTYLTSILEARNKPANTVKEWKTLVTIAHTNDQSAAGTAYGKFKNINVNGNPAYPTLKGRDYATINISGSNVEISVSK